MFLAAAGSILLCGQAIAADSDLVREDSPSRANPPAVRDADNTRANQRDARGMTMTPMDQSNEQKDLNVTAEIRKSILSTDKFSRYAENIKIITTADRRVFLRGPVQSSQEIQEIVAIAKRSAPAYEVVNQLEIDKK